MFRIDYCRRVAQCLAALGVLAAVVLPNAVSAQPVGIDPKAEKLLRASTDYVAGLKQFSIDSRSTLEAVLKSGQRIQFDNGARLAVQRPNKLRAERVGDLVNQVFYYDGKSLTLLNPDEKVFATVAAPGTLEEMLDFARTRLDIVAPGSDLIYKNAYEVLMDGVTDGFVVGKGIVEGVRCDHLAFRAPHVDWQIWIQEGDKPLPRKFVITTKDVSGGPQFSVVVTKWNTAPKFPDGLFVFKPPKNAQKVEFMPTAAAASPAK